MGFYNPFAGTGGIIMSEPEWHRANRVSWDQLVDIHMGPRGYDLADLRAGNAQFEPIEEAELPDLDGKRIAHLQCHFGADSLRLARRGAEVVGLDFSARAIEVARSLACELELAGRARFVEADLYDALEAIPAPHGFDIVFVTWGAICWLPDIARWAQIVATLLRPGGSLYLAEGHPAALVFDDAAPSSDGMPGFFAPYFSHEPVIETDPRDYLNPDARLCNAALYNWIHPLGNVISSLIAAGVTLDWLHEHDAVTWQMFRILLKDASGLYRWPDKPWLPLAFSLSATKR
jgi:SAM-dependent methyltransferase